MNFKNFFFYFWVLNAALLSSELSSKAISVEKKAYNWLAAQLLEENYEALSFEGCQKQFANESLCRSVDKYASRFLPKDEKKSRETPKDRFKVDAQNTAKVQAEGFSKIYNAINSIPERQLKKIAEKSLKDKTCPRNLNLALAYRLEDNMHESTYQKLVMQLYENGLQCPDSTPSRREIFLQRLALFHIAKKSCFKALPYLKEARLLDGDESYRTLFWKEHCHRVMKEDSEALADQKKLLEEYPISFFSALSLSQTNKSLHSELPKKSPETKKTEPENSSEVFLWIQDFVRHNKPDPKLQAFLLNWILTIKEKLGLHDVLILAHSLQKAEYYRAQIAFLSMQLLDRPHLISRDNIEIFFPNPHMELVKKNSEDLDPYLVMALLRQESAFDQLAKSSAGAKGLMQLLPSTARWLFPRRKNLDLFKPESNIDVGTHYLKRTINQFDNSVEKALASYNAGSGNMRRWEKRYRFVEESNPLLFIDILPFRETRNYVPTIIRNAYWYHMLYGSDKSTVHSSSLLETLLKNERSKNGKEQT